MGVQIHRGTFDFLVDAEAPARGFGTLFLEIVILPIFAIDGRRAVRQPAILDTGLDVPERRVCN
jgi:hypothetical protein